MPAMMPDSRYGVATRAPGAAGAGPRCARHPAAAAGWRCPRCGDLCPDCTAERKVGLGTIVVCVHCGDLAPPITAPRGRISYVQRLPGALLYPFTVSGLLSMLALGAVMYFFPLAGWFGAALSIGIFFAYLFSLIIATANGSDDIEAPEFSDVYDDILTPARRGATATAILWVPAVVYVVFVRGLDEVTFFDPILWLILAASVIYVPMALLVAAAGNGILTMLNPVFTFRCMARLGTDYAIAVGAVVGLGLLWFVTSIVGGVVALLPIPILGGWLGAAVTAYVPFVTARVLGLLLFVRGADVGYGAEEQFQDPVLGDVRPRGTAPTSPLAMPMPSRSAGPAAVGVPAGAIPGPSGAPAPPPSPAPAAHQEPRDWPAGLTLGPEQPPVAPSQVEAALQAGQLDQALEAYAALADAERAALAPATHIRLGQRAVTRQDYALAVRAFRAATEIAGDDPEAPRAWVLLGRVYADKVGDRATAARIFQHVVERFPGSEAAAFAREQLPRGPGGDAQR